MNRDGFSGWAKSLMYLLVPAIVLAMLLAGIPLPFISHVQEVEAQPNAPRPDGCVTDGEVFAVATSPTATYIGGDFSHVGPRTGHGVSINADTGELSRVLPFVNDDVRTAIPDGAGGFYIGGDFTEVDHQSRMHLAHILSDGTLDLAWAPGATNDSVTALALSPDGMLLFVGGSFSMMGGVSRNRIGAIETATGQATEWAPDADGAVLALLATDDVVYAGGSFDYIGGQNRAGFVELNASGTATGLNEYLYGGTQFGPVVTSIVLAPDEHSVRSLYIGGAFAYGLEEEGGRNLKLANWAVPPTSTPTIHSLFLDAGTLYIGTDTGMLAFNAYTCEPTGWQVGSDGPVRAINRNGTAILAGGSFNNMGGQTRDHLAALDAVTGAATAWDPRADRSVFALAASGGNVYAGGEFASVGYDYRNNIAALDAITGAVLDWDADADGRVRALALEGSTLYAAGEFGHIGGQPRDCIAALDPVTGTVTPWNPHPNNWVLSLAPSGSVVYLGGWFTSIDGQPRNHIAALDAITGAPTTWNPNANDIVHALAVSGNTVYASGDFYDKGRSGPEPSIGGQPRDYIAALDATAGVATDWDPDASFTVNALVASGDIVYAGGSFSTIGGQSRRGLAALDISSGAATDWNANCDSAVTTIALSAGELYVGGHFDNAGGETRHRLAALDTTSGLATAWDPPEIVGGTVNALAVRGNSVYAGGDFLFVGGEEREGFAQFAPAEIQFAAASSSAREGETAGIELAISDPAAGTEQVSYSAVAGSAVPGEDYVLLDGTISFPEGATTASIPISIVDDALTESPETVVIGLSSPANAYVGPVAYHTFTILDNECPVVSSRTAMDLTEGGASDGTNVRLTRQPSSDVTIDMTSELGGLGAAPATLTFTPENWATDQAVAVSAIDDGIVQGNHTDRLVLRTASEDPGFDDISPEAITVNITDVDNYNVVGRWPGGLMEGQTGTASVRLGSRPASNVDVWFKYNEGNRRFYVNATLHFTPENWSTPQDFNFSCLDNQIAEGSYTELYDIYLTSEDPHFNYHIWNVTAWCYDNDVASVILSKTSLNVSEGGTTDSYAVKLNSQPQSTVTVDIVPSSTAVTTSPPTLSFESGNYTVEQVVTVTAQDDSVVEGDHTCTITGHCHSFGDHIYDNRQLDTITAYITDDDFYTIAVSADPPEGGIVSGGGSTYGPQDTVQLGAMPAPGYNFVNWTEGETPVSPDPAYSFTVESNRELVANFALNTYPIQVTQAEHGSIAPAGDAEGKVWVEHGADQTFTIIPDEGYHLGGISTNQGPAAAHDNRDGTYSYTFVHVEDNDVISAYFEPDLMPITVECGANGSIQPAGDGEGKVWVEHGQDQTFYISPDFECHVSTISTDEGVEGLVDNGDGTYSYTFSNVTGPHWISAGFEPGYIYVEIMQQPHGTISPGGDAHGRVWLDYYATQTFTVTPDAGYRVGAILTEEGEFPPVDVGDGSCVFIFEHVTQSHELTARFEPLSVHGTVTGSDGVPLQDIYVIAYDAELMSIAADAFTGPGGEYQFFGLTPGSYKLEFIDPTDVFRGEWFDDKSPELADTVLLTAEGAVRADAQLAMLGKIAGSVTGSGGEDLGSIRVLAESSLDPGVVRETLTDPAGHYEITGLETGTYRVSFRDRMGDYAVQWFDGMTTEAEADEVPVTEGSITSGIDAEMVPASVIYGTVTRAGTPDPIQSVMVIALQGETIAALAYTGSAGEYELKGLAAGTYRLMFSPADATYRIEYYDESVDIGGAALIDLAVGERRLIDEDLFMLGQIRGIAERLEGVQYVDVAAYDEAGDVVQTSGVMEDGSYVIPGLLEGTYFLRFYGSCATEWYKDAARRDQASAVIVEEGQITDLDNVTLEPGTAIYGTISEAGSPAIRLSGVTVTVNDGEENEIASGTTDGQGGYVIGGIPPGSYRIRFLPAPGAYYAAEWHHDRSSFATADVVEVTQEAPVEIDEGLARLATFTIEASAGPGGTIEPSGFTNVTEGGDITFIATPSAGFHFACMATDTGPVSAVDEGDGSFSYTFYDVTEQGHTINASFAINTYTITVTQAEHGTIIPDPATVEHGADKTFTITPDSGYHVADVRVDGESVGAVSGYTFQDVTAAGHTITAIFAINTYAITVTQPKHGTITPDPATVEHGADMTFTVTPATGYHVADVVVDSTDHRGPVPGYTFEDVTEEGHTITASFALNTYTITATPDPAEGGHVVGAGTYEHGTSVTLTASAAPSYRFANWTEGASEVSTDPAYSFSATGPRALTAHFAFTGNTPGGSNSTVNPGGGTQITFTNVTEGGTTTSTHQADPSVANFSVLSGSCYDIRTDASYTGPVNITLSYSEVGLTFPESELKLLHYEGGAWRDCTVSVDTAANRITGRVNSLSPFVIAHEVTPAGGSLFYFAEGYTGPGFQEYLCIGNPGTTDATAHITYLYTDGTSESEDITVPASSRATVDVNASAGAGRELSVKVESAAEIVAERPMYFSYGPGWTGGHDAVGATRTSLTWYFAEGYTGPGFDEWICVLNPGTKDATLTFSFQTEQAGEILVTGRTCPANSRRSFKANELLGGAYETSLKLTSTEPVVAERPMYFNYSGMGNWGWTGGHCVMGAPELATSYYFAEGTTRGGFEEWLTLQNPGTQKITVTATYQLGAGQGAPVTKTYEVDAGKRRTLFVPNEGGAGVDVSVKLTCPAPFLAERPIYFNYTFGGAPWTGGHCVIGASAPATDWFLAEGYTGAGFHEWLCIQNPGAQEATIEITYCVKEGSPVTKGTAVPANSRMTVPVNTDAGAGLELSCRIRSTNNVPVIVERPMYFDYSGWNGGHDVVGYVP